MKPHFHALGLGLLLVSCATVVPAPQVVIKTIDVPVPVHCKPALGPDPVYADTDAALKAAPDLFGRVQLLVEGRIQRIQRDLEKSAALTACE